ncbi:MAG TPA: hypothetical protein DEF00_04660 [Candidatus Taylorbacteria bacterium]|nr:hypothetical protein [Candidatus Taylorbacteria bacterium]
MKMSEIPKQIFSEYATEYAAKIFPDEHLGGTLTIAPMEEWNCYAVFGDHPRLNCSSFSIFRDAELAFKGLFPTCSVQVGPHNAGWDKEQGACRQELKASFSVRNAPLPFQVEELRLIREIRERLEVLEKIAEREEFTEFAFDLVE